LHLRVRVAVGNLDHVVDELRVEQFVRRGSWVPMPSVLYSAASTSRPTIRAYSDPEGSTAVT